jgi:hypothetical protein
MVRRGDIVSENICQRVCEFSSVAITNVQNSQADRAIQYVDRAWLADAVQCIKNRVEVLAIADELVAAIDEIHLRSRIIPASAD